MRILTWNVNVLRTVLDYHPWSSMENKTVEGLLEGLKADISCFQEHKTRRPQFTKAMACPGVYDCFCVCTYVDSRVCVPLKAEEGITGLLLDDPTSTMKPPWTPEERIGYYPDMNDIDFEDEVDGTPFDPRRLDTEGRSVVIDCGMFILFNLYCPNETNETRRPYKLNFYKVLHERVRLMMAAGREVILAGDMNIMRAPIDSGEGGIKTTADQHYQHPARVWLENWCAPKGPMVDVVRESFPDREGMFTCWNTKIDARPANYGSRIDYVLCTPGLRPWIKGGDIDASVHGSDHCPVYIDLHDSIEVDGETVFLRDLLNPKDRPPSTAPVYPSDIPRTAPEPPRFATKFLEEFSAKQRTLMSLWGGAKSRSIEPSASPSPAPTPTAEDPPETQQPPSTAGSIAEKPSSSPLAVARGAFAALDGASQSKVDPPPSSKPAPVQKGDTVDLTSDEPPRKKQSLGPAKSAPAEVSRKPAPKPKGQQKLAAFWSAPASSSASASTSSKPKPAASAAVKQSQPEQSPPRKNIASQSNTTDPALVDTEHDELIAQAIAQADEERERERKAKQDAAAPVWSNLFAKKLPPLCTVHQKPCKDFIVKITGPNKGKRFWLCSLPVGPGYDMGRSKRPREDVDSRYKCDFFLWDTANSRKETPKSPSKG
ncbi:DNA-(apurinic or apyrimidinic site) lyase 2 [Vanrija pseudolonga]|uniref:DNA-(apurinic or apyrimidinic site) endonuclease n=1 Tax=Vanrija pseudolonga TaxID=143232 RepID=A0AAF1BIV0_9TREE|nr:DNA-(apurinic or apyrimidinic site) lyase 2 [Vanrija pseudolonga]